MREVLGEHPQYGYRRLAQDLRRRAVPWGVGFASRGAYLSSQAQPPFGSARQGYLGIVLLAGERAGLRAFPFGAPTPSEPPAGAGAGAL